MNKTIYYCAAGLAALFSCAQAGAVPLAGAYDSGGTTPDYASIQAAVNDLHANGISAPVDFVIHTGTYDEQITLLDFTRTGNADDRVTFRRDQPFTSVTWQYSTAGAANNWVLKIDGAHHITVRGMHFVAANANFADLLLFAGGSHDVIVENCEFSGQLTLGTLVLQDETGEHNNNAFLNNTFTGGERGIDFDYIFGGLDSLGLEISGNSFGGQIERAIETGSSGAIIRDNFINDHTISDASYVAIDAEDASPVIENNELDVRTGMAGIWVFAFGGSAFESRVVNNLVALRSLNGSRGIFIANDNVSVYHNTVRVTDVSAPAMMISDDSQDVRLRNNIFVHDGGGYALQVLSGGAELSESDYNLFYSSGAFPIDWEGTDYADAAALSAETGMDLHSLDQSVSFISTAGTNDLRLAAPSDAEFSLLAPLLASVPEDVDGDLRGEYRVYRGADAGVPIAPLNNADTVSGFYTVGGASPDFLNPNEALDHLSARGMTGPVTLRIRGGSYIVHRTLHEVARFGDAADELWIRAANINNPPDLRYSAAGADDNWVVRLIDTSHVRFSYLQFTSTANNGYGRLLDIDGDSDHIRFLNNTFNGQSGASGSHAALVYSNDPGQDALEFTGNTFNGGSEALYLSAFAFTQPRGEDLLVEYNHFDDQSERGLYSDDDYLVLTGNLFTSDYDDFVAVHTLFTRGITALGNKLQLTGLNTTGFEIEGTDGRSFFEPGLLGNNFILAGLGINMHTSVNLIYTLNNSIVADVLPVQATGMGGNMWFINNILINTGSGPALLLDGSDAVPECDYNNYVSAGSDLVNWDGLGYDDLEDLRMDTGRNDFAVSTPVQFVNQSGGNLHLDGASVGDALLSGTPVDFIVDDYDGDARSPSTVYIGADEAAVALPPLDLIFRDGFED